MGEHVNASTDGRQIMPDGRQIMADGRQILRVDTPAALEELLTEHPDYDVQLESLDQWQLAWRRFKRHRMALVGSVLFLGMMGIGIVGPIILPFDQLKLVPADQVVSPTGRGPMLVPYFHPFGETAGLQQDVLTMVVNGIRLSLLISILATIFSTLVGTTVGALAGYFGRWTDTVLMRIVDALLALPLLFLIVVFSKFLGSPGTILSQYLGTGSWITVMLVFAFFGWMNVARLVRSVLLSLREEDYVDAARAAGISNRRIIFRHLLPNALSPIIVASTLSIAGVIIGEAFVSFVGYGVSPSTPTLGNILSDSQNAITVGNWWWAFFPGVSIVLIVLGISFMGDGLQDALDPRSKI
jgi:ABC-type dipeptide/oligopeptide/nickel transport system permease subunit